MMISSTASVYLPWVISLLRSLFNASNTTRHSISVKYRYLLGAILALVSAAVTIAVLIAKRKKPAF